jgi:small neutral amino acid transporter SnatA (MarC family)
LKLSSPLPKITTVEQTQNRKTDRLILNVIIILLIAVNVIFLIGKFLPNLYPAFFLEGFKILKENKGYFTILEFLGAATLFVDLVGRFEQFEARNKVIRVSAIAFIMVMFLVKIFVFYIDSAYLAE